MLSAYVSSWHWICILLPIPTVLFSIIVILWVGSLETGEIIVQKFHVHFIDLSLSLLIARVAVSNRFSPVCFVIISSPQGPRKPLLAAQ